MIYVLLTALALAKTVRAHSPSGKNGATSAMNDVETVYVTMTAATASFPDKATLLLSGVSPVVSHLSTDPVSHSGTWDVSAFTGADLSTPNGWLGHPDATLEGVLADGTKVAIRLGYLDKPVFDRRTNTISISSGYGNTSQLAPDLPTGDLFNVALSIDLTMRKPPTDYGIAKKSGDKTKSSEKSNSGSGGSTYDFMLAYGDAG